MAWEMVNYSCGHSERQQFYGHHTDRENKKEWMERGICPECYRKQKEEERVKASQVAAEQAKVNGLPALIGSEKQIAWAETIRKNALASSNNTILPADRLTDEQKSRPAYKVAVDARNRLETETSAKWWIDNRDTTDSYVRACCVAALEITNK